MIVPITLHRDIIMKKTKQGFPFDFETNKRFSPIYQSQLTQATIIMPGGGCAYFRANKGNVCPFCTFPIFSRKVIRGEGYENSFKRWTLDTETYTEMYLKSVNAAGNFDKLAIFNGGSFFPNSELPADFQRFVYQDVNSRKHVKQLMVEAYPSFISEVKLREAKEILNSTDFMVGIGFESQNDFIRNVILKKRIQRELFEEKVRLMQRLGIQVFVYAFLKAPELTEKQALDETLATMEYLHNLGVDEIALSSAFVPPETKLETLYNEGKFRPPWLWSILKIIEIAEQKGWPLSVGGFDDTPPPIAGPNNCPDCDPKINRIINEQRLNGLLPKETHNIHCTCHDTWLQAVKDPEPFLRIM